MLELFKIIRNVGQFHAASPSAATALTPFSLIYGENGRGKTTVAAILRSLAYNKPKIILDRKRLGAQESPHIVIQTGAQAIVFQNGMWHQNAPDIAIFDDEFVAENVCSGIDLESSHRQNLHELILGAQGVKLNTKLQAQVAKIEEHNAKLRKKGEAIPAKACGSLTVDKFCELKYDPEIDAKLQEAERRVAAAKSADAIRQRPVFQPISLPDFNTARIDEVLAEGLAELEAHSTERVKHHLAKLGDGGEAWVADGMARIECASHGVEYTICPFCEQPLDSSTIIDAYRAYFSASYKQLIRKIRETENDVKRHHGGDARASFEREIRKAVQNHEFWKDFTQLPAIDVDTATISREWAAAQEAVLRKLRAKASSPLEPMELDKSVRDVINTYRARIDEVSRLSDSLADSNERLRVVKEQAGGDDVSALITDLDKLTARRSRFDPAISPLCEEYLAEKNAKRETEKKRGESRAALDRYREQIFPKYELAINEYLKRFNAGFRIGQVESVNVRGGSSASYCVIINQQEVDIKASDGPNFRNTLSAGDRATLALAFFFASLDQDPTLAEKIVVLDDPMTSLDEHRTLATRQQVRLLVSRVRQVVVLSHSKSFLCALWESSDKNTRSALRISRAESGSGMFEWDVHDDCLTEHDKRHELVARYLRAANPNEERKVAEALRPILEGFVRVAYPQHFPPGALLGQFIDHCRSRQGTPDEILSESDTNELRALLDYANKFHHDSNRTYETEHINDSELTDFARRTILFSSRG